MAIPSDDAFRLALDAEAIAARVRRGRERETAQQRPRRSLRLHSHSQELLVLYGQIIAYLQLSESDTADEVELRSMAVADHRQRQGLGRALVARAIAAVAS